MSKPVPNQHPNLSPGGDVEAKPRQRGYLDHATTTAQVMTQTWFGPDGPTQWVDNNDYWRTPNLMTALTNWMALSGQDTYMSTIQNAQQAFYIYFNPATPPDQRYLPAYYDDEGWWGVGFMHVYDLTKQATYLTSAQQVFDDLKAGWDDVCKGGLWFERNPKSYPDNFKATISTELYFELAARLANCAATKSNPVYLEQAQQCWTWFEGSGLINSNGLVWNELSADCTVYAQNPPYTYTQGVILEGLWGLYAATGDASYLDHAEQIAQATLDTMVWSGDDVLQALCERDDSCGLHDTNPALFKGVFVRHLGTLARNLNTLNDPDRKQTAARYAAFLQHNAEALWSNYPKHVFGMDWHTLHADYQPTGNTQYDGSLQCSALDLFNAAALVSS